MHEPFKHPRALLNRALTHLNELEYQTKAHFGTNAYRITQEHDPDEPTWNLVKVRFAKPLSVKIPCITFDAINCLRSTLDYAVFDASALIRAEENPDSTKFPFADTFSDLKAEFKRGAKGVPTDLHDFLIALEPFKDGKGRALWALNKFRNSKIHRTVIPFAIGAQSVNIGGTGNTGSIQVISRWDKNDQSLAVYRTRGTSPGITLDVEPGLALHHEKVSVSNAVQFLRDVASDIDRILVEIKMRTVRISP